MPEKFYSAAYARAVSPLKNIVERQSTTMTFIRRTRALLCVLSLLLCTSANVTLAQSDSSEAKYGLTPEQYNYVQSETAEGGKLDFEPQMGDKYFVLIDSIAYNKRSGALVVWGQAMRTLGVRNADDAVSLYEEVRAVTLREPQRKAIRHGFSRKSQ